MWIILYFRVKYSFYKKVKLIEENFKVCIEIDSALCSKSSSIYLNNPFIRINIYFSLKYEIYMNKMKFITVFTHLLKFITIFTSLLKFITIFTNLLKFIE